MAQTVEKVYKLTVEGADSINTLKTAIEQLTEKLKTLNEQTQEYKDTLEELAELQGKLSEGFGDIDSSAMDAFLTGLAEGLAEAATAATETKDNIEELGQANSVKELKQQISDLRDKLVQLEKGSDEYKSTVDELIDKQVKLKEVMNAGKNETQAAEGSYNALSQRMAALKQVWKETTDEATRNEIGQQINQINTELKALDASIGNSQRNVGNYKSALDGLDASFVNWKQELKECKDAMQQLDPASQEYNDAMMRAAEITHNMAEQQEQIKYSSQDLGDRLETIRGIGSNLAAGFSAVNAAMGLFGEENEEVQQAMLKVQQAMALVQGLQGMEGFLNKTKGLSKSFGLATKATQANTVATKANATASKADAVAKGAETVATEAAVPAQLSLNAAMKANPIGFIIGLIATLVTAFVLLKDKIMEMIGANEEMSEAFNKVKAVLAGFGNIIKKSIINPIKMAIIPIKTLAKVMIDLFKGDWSAIGDDIKEGFTEMKDTAIDSINVVKQFKEGYDKESAEQAEAARKAMAEARKKELDDVIKDNEAKYTSDWKYTEKGKKAYMEYFKSLAEMYDQDSEEYKQALRDKDVYMREFREHQKEEAEKQEAWELRVGQAYYGADYEFSQEWYNKKYDAWKKIEDQKWLYEMANQMDAYQKHEVEWLEYLDRYNKHWETKAKEGERAVEQVISKFKSTYEKYLDFHDVWKMQNQDAETVWNEGVKAYRQHLIDMYKYTEDEADAIIAMLKGKKLNDLWDNLSKGTREKLEKELYNIEHETKQTLNYLQAVLNGKKLTIGIEFPDEEIEQLNVIYNTKLAEINLQLSKVGDAIGKMVNEYADKYNVSAEAAREKLAEISPEFKKMLDKEQELLVQHINTSNELYSKIADVWKEYYDRFFDSQKVQFEKLSKQREELFNQDFNNAMRWQGVYDNAVRDLYDNRDYLEESYQLQIGYYTKIRDAYIGMSQDMELTNEQRENAAREAAKITNEIMEEEWRHQTEMVKLQKQLIKEWTNAVKDAASGVGNILGTIGDSWSSLIELEKTEIETELENGKISQEEADRRQKQNEQSFENLKKIQIAEAIINALASAVGAYQSMASIPYVGPVLGAIAAAAALASGYAQVRQIQATTYESASVGGGSSSSSSTNFQLPDVMEYESSLGRNLTGMDDIDNINNDGSGRGNGGRGERAIKAYVVESDVSASQELARKRNGEVTF